jgi:hypothetical protein
VRLSNSAKVLAIVLAVYAVFDVLLTPVGQLETRPVADVKVLGFVTLGLLFVGLALAVVSLILLFRGSPRAAMVAVAAGVLYFPAAIADQTGLFSSLSPPTAIARLELAQSVVALVAVGLALWMLRRRPLSRSER